MHPGRPCAGAAPR